MPAAKTDIQALQDHTKELANGCHVWVGYLNSQGYGQVHRKNVTMGAHRLSYVVNIGPIPDGCEIDHLCRNRACVNPTHLEAVPHRVNVGRGDYKSNHRNGRKTHCKHGHELSHDNVKIEVWSGIAMRKCIICLRAKNNRNYLKRKLMALVHGIKVREVA